MSTTTTSSEQGPEPGKRPRVRSKITPPSTQRTHGKPRHERRNHVRDRFRSRAGAAWARVSASGTVLADLLAVHHTAISQRKAGQGWLAAGCADLHVLARAGIDVTPILGAMVRTVLEGRAEGGHSVRSLELREMELDAAEALHNERYLAGVGSRQSWLTALREYVDNANLILVTEGGR